MDKSFFRPIHSGPISSSQIPPKSVVQPVKSSFSQHLDQVRIPNQLVISKHARDRLTQRGIEINKSQWGRIEEKVNEARKLGVKDSLVLLQDAALIVSAKNNTVITAMERKEANSQIFTNINGTIILE